MIYRALSPDWPTMLRVPKRIGYASENYSGDQHDSDCAAPHWDRQPARVTFLPKVGDKLSVTVRGHFVDEVADDDSDEP